MVAAAVPIIADPFMAEANTRAELSAATEPVVTFDRSCRKLFEDRSRVVAANFHRQKGKDFTAAGIAVDRGLESICNWFIVSMTQRQADATFEKCLQFAHAAKKLMKIIGELRMNTWEFEAFDSEINQRFVFKAREIILPNGSRIVSLPGRDPDTLAGLTGNIILTEFGLFPNGGYAHWSVIFPIITRGFQIIVISTPRGKATKFYEICSDTETYSVHICDIYKSVNEEGFVLRDNNGKPTTIEQFRRLYKDEGKWPREYECKFTGDLEALIKWMQLEQAAALSEGLGFRCMRIDGESGYDAGFFQRELPSGVWLNVGWDVARIGDLSVIPINWRKNGKPDHLAEIVIMKGVKFAMQRMVAISAMDSAHGRSIGAGDNTGLGMDSNETLTTKYKDRWEGVNFGGSRKKELASGLATAFGDGTQTIPPLDGPYKFIATDLYAIQKDDTGGQLSLDETENPLLPDSHCDIAWGLALAHYAGTKKNLTPPPKSSNRRPVGM